SPPSATRTGARAPRASRSRRTPPGLARSSAQRLRAGILAERDLDAVGRAVLVLDLQRHRLARLVGGEAGAELVGRRRGLAVKRADHVAGLQPRLGGGTAGGDAADVDAVAGVADVDAEVGAPGVDDVPVADDLPGDALDGVAGDREADARRGAAELRIRRGE